MNAKSTSAHCFPAPVIRPPNFANWTFGTDQYYGTRNRDYLDSLASVSREGQAASGPDSPDHRQRYEDRGNNGARGTLAGLVEAWRCALGVSRDRAFVDYVMKQRARVIDNAERVLGRFHK